MSHYESAEPFLNKPNAIELSLYSAALYALRRMAEPSRMEIPHIGELCLYNNVYGELSLILGHISDNVSRALLSAPAIAPIIFSEIITDIPRSPHAELFNAPIRTRMTLYESMEHNFDLTYRARMDATDKLAQIKKNFTRHQSFTNVPFIASLYNDIKNFEAPLKPLFADANGPNP